MMECDWCHKPICDDGDKGWAHQLQPTPFHSLSMGEVAIVAPPSSRST